MLVDFNELQEMTMPDIEAALRPVGWTGCGWIYAYMSVRKQAQRQK